MKYSKLAATLLMSSMLVGFIPPTNVLTGSHEVQAAETILDENGSLTLNKKVTDSGEALSGAEFSIYKVMDFKPGGNHGSDYVVEPLFADVLADLTPDKISGYNTTQLEGLIDKLGTKAKNATANYTAVSDTEGNVKFDSVDTGYYLVVETAVPEGYVNTAKPFLISVPNTEKDAENTWNYDVKVELKNDKVNIDKSVTENKEDDISNDPEKITAGVGDTLNYHVTANVIKYPADAEDIRFAIRDTLSKGLTLDKGSVEVYGYNADGKKELLVADTHYKQFIVDNADGTTNLQIYFYYDQIKDFSKVKAEYAAVINEHAVVGGAGNENSAVLEYSTTPEEGNDYTPGGPGVPTDPTDPTEPVTPPDKTGTYVTKIDLLKLDGKDASKLAGAEFGLFLDKEGTKPAAFFKIDADGNAIGVDGVNPAITGADGKAGFTGLKAGTYYLKETKAPEGYQLLADVVEIIIAADESEIEGQYVGDGLTITATADGKTLAVEDGVVKLDVNNNKGFLLPQTGGIGTYAFTIGGLMTIIVGTFMWTQSRKKSEEN